MSPYEVRTISTCLGEVFRMAHVTIICLTRFDINTLCQQKIKYIHYVGIDIIIRIFYLVCFLFIEGQLEASTTSMNFDLLASSSNFLLLFFSDECVPLVIFF
jgi:hypothetical protein